MSEVVKEDPRFVLGRDLLWEGKYEEAIDAFSSLAQDFSARHGEMSLLCVPAWFAYGDALVVKEEESADDILGDAAAQAKAAAQELVRTLQAEGGEEGEGDEADDDEQEASDEMALPGVPADILVEDGEEVASGKQEGGEQEGEEEEEPEDMGIAWEALDVCRRIYETNSGADTDLPLSECYMRLGDVRKYSGLFDGALEEYQKSLDIRTASLEFSNRLIAEVHFQMAVARVDNSRSEGKDVAAEKRSAK